MTSALGPAGLAEYLLDTGAASPRWADAVQAVPRAAFLPDLVWAFHPDTGRSEAVDRRVDPDRFNAVAYSDTALTVQWDDGRHTGTAQGEVPTSSASQPSVVTGMLGDADLEPGMRVYEAGTGTGWSAALTAHVVGAANITTVEVDAAMGEQAAKNLAAAGSAVTAIVGDAASGWAARAPFERVIATYGVRRIPAAWITQTRPGGLIVAPWGTAYSHRDAVAKLTVAADGTASGPFTRQVEFMKARADRQQPPDHHAHVHAGQAVSAAGSALGYADVIGDRWDPQVFAVGVAVSGVTHVVDDRQSDPVVWFYSLTDMSWAAATFTAHGTSVTAAGQRDVWFEIERTVQKWIAAGRPGVERYGLTVLPDGRHTVWLDEPGNEVAVHLP